MIKVKFKLDEGVNLPQFQSELASGFDVVASDIIAVYKGDTVTEGEKLDKIREGFKDRGYIKLRAFERVLFDTGLTLADVQHEYPNFKLELQSRPRSGIATKRGLTITNSPGTVDEDYRGKIGITLQNTTPFLVTVEKGERIGQLVPSLVPKIEIIESDEVSKTERGAKGYGSTGK